MEKNANIRQFIAIISHRLTKSLDNSSKDFLSLKVMDDTPTPEQILEHMLGLVDDAKAVVKMMACSSIQAIKANQGCFAAVKASLFALYSHLQTNEISENQTTKLINGPLSDLCTLIGQLCLLRGIAGEPLLEDNYTYAKIEMEGMK